jgi:hypothetical protein
VDINKILEHIGVEPEAPRIASVRGPPLWDGCAAQKMGEGVGGFAGLGSGKPITARLPRRSAHHLVSLQQWAMGRDDCAGVGLCPSAAWRVVWDEETQILGDSDLHLRGSPFFQDSLGCNTEAQAACAQAVGNPIC